MKNRQHKTNLLADEKPRNLAAGSPKKKPPEGGFRNKV
jgi:hypothetical protein